MVCLQCLFLTLFLACEITVKPLISAPFMLRTSAIDDLIDNLITSLNDMQAVMVLFNSYPFLNIKINGLLNDLVRHEISCQIQQIIHVYSRRWDKLIIMLYDMTVNYDKAL